MPKLELGDLESVEKLKDVNVPQLAEYARQGFAILTAVPSCTLMFKSEMPLLFAGDEAVRLVAEAMFDPFEYIVARDKDGLLKKDFVKPLGKVSYHIPCHSRVQNVGQKTREVLEWVPDTAVTTVERCAGHDGTWGVKTGILRNVDEDRTPGVPANGRARSRLRQLRLSHRRPGHRAGHRAGTANLRRARPRRTR